MSTLPAPQFPPQAAGIGRSQLLASATVPGVALPPASTHIAGWVVLAVGGIRLALPQRDVRQINLVIDLKASAESQEQNAGWLIRKDGQSWPAYNLNESLSIQRQLTGRRLCIFFGSHDAVR